MGNSPGLHWTLLGTSPTGRQAPPASPACGYPASVVISTQWNLFRPAGAYSSCLAQAVPTVRPALALPRPSGQNPSMKVRLPSSGLVFASLAAFLALTGIRAAEHLDRGTVALPRKDGSVYIGWRLLAADSPDAAFDVYRADSLHGPRARLNATPIVDSCNWMDTSAGGRLAFYFVEPAHAAGTNQAARGVQASQEDVGYVRLKLQGNYRAQKVGLADFDGDGRLDYLVKQPDFNTDPYQQPGYWKRSEDTYKLEAYRHDGTFLWRYDMGWAIEEGIWYSPIVVYDLDGDGKAEVFCKAGEGDPREPTGHVRSGPEYLVMLDGLTGQVKKTPPLAEPGGLRRLQLLLAQPAGHRLPRRPRPHLIVERGTYKIIKVQAYDPVAHAQMVIGKPAGRIRESIAARACTACTRGCGRGRPRRSGHRLRRARRQRPAALEHRQGPPGCLLRGGHRPGAARPGDLLRHRDRAGRATPSAWWRPRPANRSGAIRRSPCTSMARAWWATSFRSIPAWNATPARPRAAATTGSTPQAATLLGHENLGELAPKAVSGWTARPRSSPPAGKMLYKWPREEIGAGGGPHRGDRRLPRRLARGSHHRARSARSASIPRPSPPTSRRVCLMQDRLYRTDVAMQTMGYFYPPQLGGTPLPPSAR